MRGVLCVAVIIGGASGCNVAGCIANQLVDGGIPSAEDQVFDETMGDPEPLASGGTTTYAGLDFTTTIEGTSRTLEVSAGGTVVEQYVYANGDDTDVSGTGDTNEDGNVDWQYRSLYDGSAIVTTIELTDQNFDGVFDSKDVWSVDVSHGLPFDKTETFYTGALAVGAPIDGGSWTQMWTSTAPAIADAHPNGAGGCIGTDGFPNAAAASLDGNWVRVREPATLIRIAADPGKIPGSCTVDQANQIAEAFKHALEDIADCAPLTRYHLAVDVKLAVQKRELYVACNNSCPNAAATTDLPYASGPLQAWAVNRQDGFQRMNVNPTILFAKGPLGAEEVLLHELIHFAGFDHTPGGSDGSPTGHDMPYGCGRYCVRGGRLSANSGGCQHGADGVATVGWDHQPPLPVEYAFDCADCANEAHRASCGAGLFEIPKCDSASCADSKYSACDPATICCETIPLSCWAKGQTDLTFRNPRLQPETHDACRKSGCMAPDEPSCAVGNPVDFAALDGKPACEQFPIGWCQGP